MSELASLKDEPNAISGIVASVLNYGSEHPYGEVATEETCSNLTVNDCRELYNKYFNAYDSYMVFVGDIKAIMPVRSLRNFPENGQIKVFQPNHFQK